MFSRNDQSLGETQRDEALGPGARHLKFWRFRLGVPGDK
jgi:hypothetical protein